MNKTEVVSRIVAAETNFESIVTMENRTRVGIAEDAAITKTHRSLCPLFAQSRYPCPLQRAIHLKSGSASFYFLVDQAQATVLDMDSSAFEEFLERTRQNVEETRESLMDDARHDRPRSMTKWDRAILSFYDAVWGVHNLGGTVVLGPAGSSPWAVEPVDPVLLRAPTESKQERATLTGNRITGITITHDQAVSSHCNFYAFPLAVTLRIDHDVREIATELTLAQIDQIRLMRSKVSGEVESRDGAVFRAIGELDIASDTES